VRTNDIYDNKNVFASIFLCLSNLHYSKEYVYKSEIDHVVVSKKNSKSNSELKVN
jgi:hypothetical protein